MILRCFGSGSTGNCYALMNDTEILILDAGIRYKEVLKGIDYRISDVAGVCVTHEHSDHAKYTNDWIEQGVGVWTPYLPGTQFLDFGRFKVWAFPVKHDNVECRGFLIQHKDFGKLLYMTDLEFCKFNFQNHRVNHMIIEANYDKRYIATEDSKRLHVLNGHCEIETTIGIIKANQTDALKSVLLCHLSRQSADPMDFIERVEKVVSCPVRIAEKGMEYELD